MILNTNTKIALCCIPFTTFLIIAFIEVAQYFFLLKNIEYKNDYDNNLLYDCINGHETKNIQVYKMAHLIVLLYHKCELC